MKKVNLNQVYLFCLWLYTFSGVVGSSVFDLGIIRKSINAFILITLVTIIIIRGKIKRNFSILYLVLITTFIISAISTQHANLLICMLFILSVPNINFIDVAKISINAQIIGLIIVIALSLLGILKDYTYLHLNKIAHSFGFTYYTTIPFHLLCITNMYMYINKKNKLHYTTILCLLLANTIVFYFSTVRLVYYILILSCCMYIFYIKLFNNSINTFYYRIIANIAFPMAIVFIYCITINYSPAHPVYAFLNTSIFNGRLSSSQYAMGLYPITLFGQKINFIGGYEATYNFAANQVYTFIDSGFLSSLVNEGLIFTIIIISIYSILYRYSVTMDEKELFIYITIILIFSLLNNIWVSLIYNPIIVLTLKAFSIELKKRLQHHKNTIL